ncbi:ABC transporter permease subunit [Winogradskyella sp. 3972H.M.0a.05]|uniref:ABC transporter permease n=1 Tax=Winogradskyella sp. 3972H.M.0a.05 TaxID=2950277 RepID=UPI003397CB68
MNKIKHKFKIFIIPILFILLWEIIARSSNSPVYFPPVSLIIGKLISLLGTSDFIIHCSITIYRCFIGFFIATLIAVPLGIILGANKKIYQFFHFIIEFFRPLPSASVIPIAILFLGIDDTMKIFVILFGSLWPILINTIDGVIGIEPQFLKTAKVFNINQGRILKNVIFPSILPQIFTGLKISVAISLILAITVEMIVGGNGIGFFILDSERSFQFVDMYAGVLMIGILGYLINVLFLKLEKWVIFWR